MTTTRTRKLDEAAFEAIAQELARARQKFPANKNNFAALIEEVGELARALLEYQSGQWPLASAVYSEAIQVAAMATRCAVDGDSAYELAGVESWHAGDDSIMLQARAHLQNLRQFNPGMQHAMQRLTMSASKIGEYLFRAQAYGGTVFSVHTTAAYCVAWAVRIAVEGDADFSYTAAEMLGLDPQASTGTEAKAAA